jgi:guanylate kinase
LSRSWTTRGRRSGETEDAYTFVDKETFLRRVAEGGFLEWATVLDEYYGTPVPEPPPGRDVVFEIDVQGAKQVLEHCDEVVCVLLVAPSREAQEQRLRERGDSEEHVRQRVELGDKEIAEGAGIVDAVVVNDDLDRAVDELGAIIAAARRRFADSQGETERRQGQGA